LRRPCRVAGTKLPVYFGTVGAPWALTKVL
jgi:hypothetical protein